MPDTSFNPRRYAFLTAEWRWLAMLNYSMDAAALEPFVPWGTTLDSWNGETLVSVVGFRFLRTRLLGAPLPMHRDFDEVNLRFYVRAISNGETRRGVVFIREIVPRRAIALVARLAYNEPYIALPMRSVTPPPRSFPLVDREPGPVEYAWRHGRRWNRLALETTGTPTIPEPGSQEDFITEHYWGTLGNATAAPSSIRWTIPDGASGKRVSHGWSVTWPLCMATSLSTLLLLIPDRRSWQKGLP